MLPVNPSSADEYLYDGKYVKFETSQELYRVRGGKPVSTAARQTVHGPVIAAGDGTVRVAGMSLGVEGIYMEQLVAMLRATNTKEFRDAVALRQIDNGSVFAADRHGSIFYGWLNRIALRDDRFDWTKPVDGSRAESAYRGVMAYRDMPQSFDDPGGYYQASNAANWYVPEGAWGLRPASYPNWMFLSSIRHLPARPQRVVDLISDRRRHTIQDAMNIAVDHFVLSAEWAFPAIRRSMKALGFEDEKHEREALSILGDWVASGPAASLTSEGYTLFREISGEIGQFGFAQYPNAWGRVGFPDDLDREQLERIHDAFTAAVATLVSLHGRVAVPWGSANVIELADGRQFSSGAGDATTQTSFQGTQRRRGTDGKWRVEAGSDFMQLTEMRSPPRIFTLVPYGQSDDPESPHFADQTERWVRGEWKSAAFARNDVVARRLSRRTVTAPRPADERAR